MPNGETSLRSGFGSFSLAMISSSIGRRIRKSSGDMPVFRGIDSVELAGNMEYAKEFVRG